LSFRSAHFESVFRPFAAALEISSRCARQDRRNQPAGRKRRQPLEPSSNMSDTQTSAPSRDDFASMLEASLAGRDLMEGAVVRGTVTAVLHDTVVIDVGLKTEGRVALREFTGPGSEAPKLGEQVDIYLERIENALGEAVLSRDKARREEAWDRLEKTFESKEPVNGAIVGRVKGGFTVDLGGASAFLPGSQVDIRPVRDVAPLMNKEQPFAILKMDRPRGNI
ncbi:unnamed protein product, partial [Chrysoparadoxa australica]